ncbi:hypothetical protein GCM10010978_14270 [Compostibacillus humi]|uniref:ATPase dynein-related AAA domain-containing protein n=1 Tax=Compostibacillus humi TaxID=1245525 RepID=A0A8J3EKK5_9BACI|nr:hypothetical protein GCM10010978_14270 [Compostibacillus humi]
MKKIRSWSKPYLRNIIGRKKVDWSMFEHGSTIPKQFYEDFTEANQHQSVKVGESVPVKLIHNNRSYKASLRYVDRSRSNMEPVLQLRYDTNRELKELIKNVFSTSYRYINNQRNGEKQKKSVNVPDEIAEFIDFYKTDKPFVYKMEFQSKSNGDSIMPSFWWVNQGQTYAQEKDGGFLWAPQKSKQGRAVSHHVRLLEAKVGDLVFCYSAMELKAIGIVKKEAVEATKPTEIASHDWHREGYLVELEYFELHPIIQKDEIPLDWRLNEDGPFDVNGNLKQGYFFQVSESFAIKLYKKFAERFGIEVKAIMEQNTKDEEILTIREKTKNSYMPIKEVVNHIYSYIRSKGFYYKKEEIANLFLSLKTKPFVILSGISGTGKTKLVQWFAESIGANEENGQFTLIPIRPDWNDGSDLLGYVDIKDEFKEGPLTKVIKRAISHPDLPYFVLLDEMNLARVEYYFSDILSIMESRKWEEGKIVSSNLLTKETAGFDLKLPNNIYIIGTVNMDETTHPFSKKVLDRANTIEFNRIELGNLSFLESSEEIEPIIIGNKTFASNYLHLKDIYNENSELVKRVSHELERINEALQLTNSHVGYRVRDEICFYVVYSEKAGLFREKQALDYCILQKILPRISGSSSGTDQMLRKLYLLFTNKRLEDDIDTAQIDLASARYPRSAAKVLEMWRRLGEDGFTSFWIS